MNNPTPAPQNKVTAASFTAALTGLILYFLNFIHVVATMPDLVKGFLGIVILGALTFAAGYFTKNNGGDHRADA